MWFVHKDLGIDVIRLYIVMTHWGTKHAQLRKVQLHKHCWRAYDMTSSPVYSGIKVIQYKLKFYPRIIVAYLPLNILVWREKNQKTICYICASGYVCMHIYTYICCMCLLDSHGGVDSTVEQGQRSGNTAASFFLNWYVLFARGESDKHVQNCVEEKSGANFETHLISILVHILVLVTSVDWTDEN